MSKTSSARLADRLPSASQPSTPAQRRRYFALIDGARAMLESGGEEALHMKGLARHADVALSTVYRYFPSKQWLILAVAIHRRRELAGDPARATFQTGDPSERTAGFLLENFRREQAESLLIDAIRRASYAANRETRDLVEQLRDGFLQNLVEDAGPFTVEHFPILDLIVEVADQVSFRSGTGLLSPRDARFRLLLICEMLDLDSEKISDLTTAAVVAS